MTANNYVKMSSIDTPIQIALHSARKNKEAAYKRMRELAAKVKEAGPWAGNLSLELLKAKSDHGNAVMAEKAAKRGIEKRANELGLTTIKSNARLIATGV